MRLLMAAVHRRVSGADDMTRISSISSRVLVLLIFLAGSIPGNAETAIERNVVFGMYSGLALLMDVYAPDQPNGYGLIMIPGSGCYRHLRYPGRYRRCR